MNLKETYNRIAEEWYKDHVSDRWSYEGMNALVSLLTPGSSVLNVGCGPGIEAQFLVEHGMQVFGFDISEKMIEIATREVPQGVFKTMDLREVSSLNELFDAVCMRAVLLHVPKADALGVVTSITQKLKVGGYFYMTVKEMRQDGVAEEIKIEDDYGYEYQRFFSYFTQEEIEEYFMKAQLEIVFKVLTPAGSTNWIQIIGRKSDS